MRLTCPSCSAQYEIPDAAIPQTGRDVQCGVCQTSWFQVPAVPLNADDLAPSIAPARDDGEADLPESEAATPDDPGFEEPITQDLTPEPENIALPEEVEEPVFVSFSEASPAPMPGVEAATAIEDVTPAPAEQILDSNLAAEPVPFLDEATFAPEDSAPAEPAPDSSDTDDTTSILPEDTVPQGPATDAERAPLPDDIQAIEADPERVAPAEPVEPEVAPLSELETASLDEEPLLPGEEIAALDTSLDAPIPGDSAPDQPDDALEAPEAEMAETTIAEPEQEDDPDGPAPAPDAVSMAEQLRQMLSGAQARVAPPAPADIASTPAPDTDLISEPAEEFSAEDLIADQDSPIEAPAPEDVTPEATPPAEQKTEADPAITLPTMAPLAGVPAPEPLPEPEPEQAPDADHGDPTAAFDSAPTEPKPEAEDEADAFSSETLIAQLDAPFDGATKADAPAQAPEAIEDTPGDDAQEPEIDTLLKELETPEAEPQPEPSTEPDAPSATDAISLPEDDTPQETALQEPDAPEAAASEDIPTEAILTEVSAPEDLSITESLAPPSEEMSEDDAFAAMRARRALRRAEIEDRLARLSGDPAPAAPTSDAEDIFEQTEEPDFSLTDVSEPETSELEQPEAEAPTQPEPEPTPAEDHAETEAEAAPEPAQPDADTPDADTPAEPEAEAKAEAKPSGPRDFLARLRKKPKAEEEVPPPLAPSAEADPAAADAEPTTPEPETETETAPDTEAAATEEAKSPEEEATTPAAQVSEEKPAEEARARRPGRPGRPTRPARLGALQEEAKEAPADAEPEQPPLEPIVLPNADELNSSLRTEIEKSAEKPERSKGLLGKSRDRAEKSADVQKAFSLNMFARGMLIALLVFMLLFVAYQQAGPLANRFQGSADIFIAYKSAIDELRLAVQGLILGG